MKKDELAKKLARGAHVSRATAADRLDAVVHDILLRLRRGKTADLPGLGSFLPGRQPAFRFEARGRQGKRERK